MTNPKILRWTAFALALVALLLSSQLLDMHARGTSDPGLLGKLCGPESVGCDKVITSRYGYFPFAPEGVSGEELRDGRIPVAALGLFYATFLAIYLGLVGSPTWPVRRLHTAVLGVVAVGVLGSFTFLGIMWGVIGHTCPLCLGTHLCNFAVAFLLWRLRPTEPGFPQEGEGLVQPVLPFPDPRLGIALGLLVLAVCAAEWHSYRAVRAGHLLGAYSLHDLKGGLLVICANNQAGLRRIERYALHALFLHHQNNKVPIGVRLVDELVKWLQDFKPLHELVV